jgi:alanyl-tRNA synthetase
MKLASGGVATGSQPAENTIKIEGVQLMTRRVDDISGGDLRNLADELRSKIRSGVVVLGSAADGKVTLLIAVTKDLVDRIPANALIQRLAPIVGGKGGGKADLAQAGGKDAEKLTEALERAPDALREILSAQTKSPATRVAGESKSMS